jgi:nucleoside-diphosphate-sugar epimerase
MYLVTGATGNVGGSVARQLHEHGHDVRALVRDPLGRPACQRASSSLSVISTIPKAYLKRSWTSRPSS